ncbi:large ribosomal subunit protein uL18m-like [Lineus longissimus]|uniref:large ribosomal subunit protein uL18m-like n=1 Tax=Lineus longissimus TaxID=88925 RepID=UPI002B4C740D
MAHKVFSRAVRTPPFRFLNGRRTSNVDIQTGSSTGCFLRWNSTGNTDSAANNENDNVSKSFVNRNPRNLEFMGIANKTDGWWLQYPRRDYWHKLCFKITNRNTIAYVQHANGKIVISASTEEWAIRKHLYSATDVAAAENIGRVLAQRCLESGITEMLFDTLETPVESESASLFQKALTDVGISLEEKEMVQKERDIGTDYERQAELGVEPTKRQWKKRARNYYEERRNQTKRVPALPFE